MIIVTLTKLFVINIVARVRSLSPLRYSIFLSAGIRSASISLMSFGVRLKNAISEPLAKPDIISSMAAKMAATYTPAVGSTNVTSLNAFVINVKSKILNVYSFQKGMPSSSSSDFWLSC